MARTRLEHYGPLIPNALTVVRLGVAAAFPLSPHGWRLGLVLVGGVSDALDGFAARKLHAISWVGALLDGIADKAFTLSVLLTITIDGPLTWVQLAGLLARDVVNGFIAAYVGAAARWDLFRRVTARLTGKIATIVIFTMLVAILWRPAIGRPLVWVGVAASVIAAADYALIFLRWAVWNIEPTHLAPEEQQAPEDP
jgi:CDP-diacylglycerol---glycerol-3-phosphate 3-phosphatidyltransferase